MLLEMRWSTVLVVEPCDHCKAKHLGVKLLRALEVTHF
jgi:hypothetical protein